MASRCSCRLNKDVKVMDEQVLQRKRGGDGELEHEQGFCSCSSKSAAAVFLAVLNECLDLLPTCAMFSAVPEADINTAHLLSTSR